MILAEQEEWESLTNSVFLKEVFLQVTKECPCTHSPLMTREETRISTHPSQEEEGMTGATHWLKVM